MKASEFASTLNDLAIHLEKDVRELTITTILDLWEDIVDSTPVDLGVAAGNWQVEEHHNSTVLHQDVLDAKEQGEYNQYSGRVVPYPDIPSPEKFSGAKGMIIFNNAPYIEELEEGVHPNHAPGAMIADNVESHIRFFEQRLRDTGLFK